jgi:hypothetical protein
VPGIYLKHGGTYVAMTERAYDAESVLQELIASHPEMLAGDAAAYGSLVLVKREVGVNDQEDGGARWSLDHLYLDAQGVPTLVEVKRRSDTRGRREVVAQMLDYAANAKTSFDAARLETWLEKDAVRRGTTTAEVLHDELGVEDLESFWQTVHTNLAAERFRLIFVSDVIGPELRKIIEFLNGQMTRTDVLAIEVKQYTDQAGEHQTIVPRVIGDTQASKAAKLPAGGGSPFDRERLLVRIGEAGTEPAVAATALLDWAAGNPRLEVTYGRQPAADIRLVGWRIFLRAWGDGTLEVSLHTLKRVNPPWDSERIEDLVQRIEAIDDVRFLSLKRNWPRMKLAPFADPRKFEQFVAIIDDVLADLSPAPPPPTAAQPGDSQAGAPTATGTA